MKKIFNHLLDKVPIIKYILTSFAKWFVIAALVCGTTYTVLSLTGNYAKVESAMDLRYNSPFVLVPLLAFAALAVLCFIIGFLLYFHKYKRARAKSRFHEALSAVLNNKQKDE